MAESPTHPLSDPPSGHSDRELRERAVGDRGWLYPRAYTWFVILAAFDVLLTYMILSPLFDDRGREVNAVAEYVIHRFGLPGMFVYKYLLVGIVVVICEYVGRRHPDKGRRLAEWAVAITAVPVVVSFVLMFVDVHALLQAPVGLALPGDPES